MSVLRLGTHNLTEGTPTALDLRCDLLAAQEVGGGLRRHFTEADRRVFLPARDRHQLLAWNPAKVEVSHKGYRRFHGSGQAERWKIATPSRGLVTIKGEDHDGKIAVGGAWLLNSWGKPDEAARHAIVTELELPVIRDWYWDMRRWGARTIVLMGDFNSIRWRGQGVGDFRQVAGGSGLDRILVWPKALDAGKPYRGPITGVGPDRKHHSVHVNLL